MGASLIEEGFIYTDNTVDKLSVVDINMNNIYTGYIVYKNTNRGKVVLLSVDFAGGGTVMLISRMLNKAILTLS
jgi:hypothetical protein